MPFAWANVAEGEIADDELMNLLGQAVEDHDTRLAVVEGWNAPGWTSYNPPSLVWGASVAPVLGNGVLLGRYRRAGTSDLVIYEGLLTAGSTTTFGSGIWTMSLPFTASSTVSAVGGAMLLDSGTQRKAGICWLLTTTTIAFVSAGDVTSTSPHTWASTDVLAWQFLFQPA